MSEPVDEIAVAVQARRGSLGQLRASDAGVILLSTLLLLALLASLAVASQARTLAQAQLLARVTEAIDERLARSGAEAMLRPLVGESLLAMSEGSTPLLAMDGTPSAVAIGDATWQVVLEPGVYEGRVEMRLARLAP